MRHVRHQGHGAPSGFFGAHTPQAPSDNSGKNDREVDVVGTETDLSVSHLEKPWPEAVGPSHHRCLAGPLA